MDRHDSRIRAVESPAMPSASGTECVRALVSLGWIPLSWTEAECRLEKGRLTLSVPLEPSLPPATVTEIVRAAGEAPLVFADALERLRANPITA